MSALAFDYRQSLEIGAQRDAQVLRLLKMHPATVEMLVRLRLFPTAAKARRRLKVLAQRRLVLPVGTVWRKQGHPELVFCCWRPPVQQLMHEVELTTLCLRINAGEILRGPNAVDSRIRPDAELRINGQRFFLELDRGTTALAQVVERFGLYEGSADYVLWVCPTEARRDGLRQHAERLRSIALFTTYAEALADPHAAIWIGAVGGRAALPRESCLPATSTAQAETHP